MPDAVPVVFWFSVGNVQLVNVPDAGVPRTGAVIVGDVSVLFVRVCVAARPTTVSLDDGKVIVVVSVPASVRVLSTVSVLAVTTDSPVTLVAAMVPVPLVVSDPPEPTVMVADEFVPLVIAENADPPLDVVKAVW